MSRDMAISSRWAFERYSGGVIGPKTTSWEIKATITMGAVRRYVYRRRAEVVVHEASFHHSNQLIRQAQDHPSLIQNPHSHRAIEQGRKPGISYVAHETCERQVL